MTTNLLSLPYFSSQAIFEIAQNADWLDAIFFVAPGSPPAPLTITGSITSGSNTVTVASAAGIVPGQPIVPVPGIPTSAFVGAIPTPTTFTIVNSTGGTLNATATDAEASLTFEPLPLDLTGISFAAEVRNTVGNPQVFLLVQTSDGSFFNSGTSGILSFKIPATKIQYIPVGSYVIDIVATANGQTVNLFPEGPATLIVIEGVTAIGA
jgi:hypothetical protein